MFKRLFLLAILIGVFYLSSTSQILVSDPSTWLNGQHREENASFSTLLDADSVFFDTYFEDDRTVEDLDFEFYIRKFLHIGIYALLAVVIFWNLPKMWFRYFISFFLTAFIAFLDEANQYTTLGRSGRLWDVFLDSSAAFVSLFLLFLIRSAFFLFKHFKEKTKTKRDSD